MFPKQMLQPNPISLIAGFQFVVDGFNLASGLTDESN